MRIGIRVFVAIAVAAIVAAPAASVRGQERAGEKRLPQSREQIHLSFAPLVRQAAPAVVNIFASKAVRARRGPTLFDDPFFRRFFGEGFGFAPEAPRERTQNSLGSGVIVRPDGVIVTNAHVIEGADEIVVQLADRRQFKAAAVGADEKTDLAVLKVDSGGEPLPHLELRDSDELEVGDMVLAVGNPFGVGQTVTSGIVSALARTTVGISDLSFFIQTDAAINPGNSGGALVAMDGRLVGINTAIFSKSGGSHGIGFAIPSNMVRAVIAGFAKGDGRLVRPWLGAWGAAVTPDVAAQLGLARPAGVVIETVYPGGSADGAGLKPGDVVMAVNGREIDDEGGLRYRIATLAVGEAAKLKVWRKSTIIEITVPLAPPPEAPPRETTQLTGNTPLAGTVVANMSPALAEEVGVERFEPGVIVLDVRRASPAASVGFRPGDGIRAINDQRIVTVADLKAALARPTERWRIAIARKGQILTVVIGR